MLLHVLRVTALLECVGHSLMIFSDLISSQLLKGSSTLAILIIPSSGFSGIRVTKIMDVLHMVGIFFITII